MANEQLGTEWSLAADGRWYPRGQHPGWPTIAATPTRTSGRANVARLGVLIALVLLLGVGAAVFKAKDATVVPVAAPRARDSVTPSEIPAGFTEFADADEGYRIAVPSSWEPIDIGSPDMQAVFDELIEENPEFGGAMAAGLPLVEQGAVLFAVDPESGTAVGLVHVAMPIPFDETADLERIDSMMRSQFEAMGADDVLVERVQLAAGEALLISVSIPMPMPGQEQLSFTEHIYILDSAKGTWMLVLVGVDSDMTGAIVDDILDSLRVS